MKDKINLDKPLITRYFQELNDILATQKKDGKVELLVVGGSLMIIKGIRYSSVDIDTIALNEQRDLILDAAKQISERDGIQADWINFNVENLNHHDLDNGKELLLEMSHLNIYGVSRVTLAAMKLIAAAERAAERDFSDIHTLKEKYPDLEIGEVLARTLEIYPHQYIDTELMFDIWNTSEYMMNVF